MQYPKICAVFFIFHLNHYNSFSRYSASLAYNREKKRQRIDDLPILVTCRSGTSVTLSTTLQSGKVSNACIEEQQKVFKTFCVEWYGAVLVHLHDILQLYSCTYSCY